MRRYSLAIGALFLLLSGCSKDSTGPDTTPPTPSGLDPEMGTVGTEIRIDGTGFTTHSQVRFDNLSSPRLMLQGGALFAVAPAGLVAGQTYQIDVSNGGAPAPTSPSPPVLRSSSGSTA